MDKSSFSFNIHNDVSMGIYFQGRLRLFRQYRARNYDRVPQQKQQKAKERNFEAESEDKSDSWKNSGRVKKFISEALVKPEEQELEKENKAVVVRSVESKPRGEL